MTYNTYTRKSKEGISMIGTPLRRLLTVPILLVLLLPVLAGCGDNGTAESSSAAASDAEAAQIVKDSQAKMATVDSASFACDISLLVEGDTSQMNDPTAKALLSQGIKLHLEGAAAKDPTAVDMSASLAVSGQTIDVDLKSSGPKAWVGYQGGWYALDADAAKSLNEQAQKSGAAPADKLKNLGIDPESWDTTYQLVGTEDLGGVEVHHVRAVADPHKLAEALAKAAEESAEKAGESESSGGPLGDLGEGLTQDKEQIRQLRESIKSASVDYWIGVDDQYLRKMEFAGALDATKLEGTKGITGFTLKGVVTADDFDAPVKVVAPKKAHPIDQLMDKMLGSMMGVGEGSL